MEHQFAVQYVVQRWSGGPKMTSEEICNYRYPDGTGQARCVLFEKTARKKAVF